MKYTLRQFLNLGWRMSLDELNEESVDRDPIKQFRRWYGDAVASKLLLPDAMTLATVSNEGKPAARMILMKSVDESGFTFYTNYNSRKSEEIAAVPWAALVFYWSTLQRQVRVEGSVTKISAEESEQYFKTRPRESQISAHASPQSEPVRDRKWLEEEFRRVEEVYKDRAIPCPSFWGGYRVYPNRIEFWKGRLGRLHDRIQYERRADGSWTITRLAP